ncbi:hypothetical protein BDV38DRAFT_287458 [Aspergillus pseudotamarii]|uniref:Fungal-specific transcription factor domain-containing protein n=1 Tax=Aspergillus pseudotamarii TaxID=132259 RepID=A0A5N6SI06_ASPPS|nr:uncharacterized protein BDV38DRAFT_287458 [Aspergillus pseudotamarii]KAE8132744.1 hypothetical protein BDV38DRAFT_287458 [Aspergillus pseudotamarii]
MDYEPSEVVFATTSSPTASGIVFRYGQRSIKVPAPRRRGRPLGSRKGKTTGASVDGHKQKDHERYEFVNLGSNSTDIDRDTRKSIRKRVMLNHTYINHKRKGTSIEDKTERTASTRVPSSEVIVPQPGRVDPFNTLSIEIEPYMHDLLSLYITTIWETLYSIEKRCGCNPMTNYWLPLAFNDPALLHSLIGCAASFVMIANRSHGYPFFVRHLNEAIAIVNQRMADSAGSVSDETLVVIASIAMMKQMLGFHDEWNVHMQGLKSLVDSRGGLDSLNDKPLIQGKIYRADLCGCVAATQRPYFGARYQGIGESGPQTDHLNNGFRELDRLLNLDSLLKEAICSLQNATQTLFTINSKDHQAKAAQVRFWITSTQYRLLSTRYRDSSIPHLQALEICRLALLLFTVTICNEFPRGETTSDMLVAQLRRLLDNDAACRWLTPEFSLWALFLLALPVTVSSSKGWCLASISAAISRMCIRREEQFTQLLATFLHDPESHAMSCQVIWSEVTS